MPVKKRLRTSDKRAAVARLKSESIEDVARAYGVTTNTVRNWDTTYGTPSPPPSSKPAAPPAPSLPRVQFVLVPNEPEIPDEVAGDGGYDAARQAAGLDPDQEPKPEEPPPEAKPEAPKVDPAHMLVMMSEMALGVSVRLYCARCKVKLDDEMRALARLTPEERENLEKFAPMAAPFLAEIIVKYGMYIGAGIYAFMYFSILTDRFAAIKERAPKKEIPAAAGTVK